MAVQKSMFLPIMSTLLGACLYGRNSVQELEGKTATFTYLSPKMGVFPGGLVGKSRRFSAGETSDHVGFGPLVSQFLEVFKKFSLRGFVFHSFA
jgi:hypothetical protein